MTTDPLSRLVQTLRTNLETDTLTDAELLNRVRSRRDPATIETIIRRHGPRVLAACRKVLGADAEVEDAFQATFLVLLRNPSAVRRKASIGAWLYGIAHRISLQARVRRACRARSSSIDIPAPPDLPWREACAVLHEELDRLPEATRLPLVLCYLEGLSRDEAALQLGRTLGSVKKSLEKGRETLRKRLSKRGVTLSTGLLAAVAEPVVAEPPEVVLAAIDGVLHPSPAIAVLARTVRSSSRLRVAGLCLAACVLAASVAFGMYGDPKPEPPKKEMPATVEAKKNAPADVGPNADQIKFAGRVVDPDGKPVKGAKVSQVNASQYLDDPPTLQPSAIAGPDGRFDFTLPNPDGHLFKFYWPTLMAWTDGFGVGLLPVKPEGAADAEIRLFPDLPVRGRILNPKGKPLVGATVRVVELGSQEAPDLAAWMKQAEGPGLKVLYPGLFDNLPHRVALRNLPGLPPARTDRDGRFTLSGIGRERVAALSVSGPGVARSEVVVVTQTGPDGQLKLVVSEESRRKWIPAIGDRPPPAGIPESGSTSPRSVDAPDTEPYTTRHRFYRVPFDHVMTREQPLEGRVTDKETGESIAGVRVWTLSPGGEILHALTDKDGRYRVSGLPPGSRLFYFEPGPDTPYHKRSGAGGNPDSIQPARLDVALPRAPWVRGRVVDERTRQPVAGAKVIYKAVRANVRAADYFERGQLNLVEAQTGVDGSFRLPGVPGRGWLMVYRTERGLSAAERPVQGDTDQTDLPDNLDTFIGIDSYILPADYQALVAVDIDPKALREYTITLDPGVPVPVALTDPDGKPVTGAIALGMRSPQLKWSKPVAGAKFDVPAFNPDRPRALVFYCPDRELGTLLQPKRGDAGPWAVRMQPTANLTGTLVLPDGKPCPNVDLTLSIAFPGQTDVAWLSNNPAETLYKTDAAGKFRIPKVIGEVDCVFWYKVHGDRFDWATIPFRAKPGETKDLGTIETKPPSK